MGILEKIQETEKEIARTQKNKGNDVCFEIVHTAHIILTLIATEYHLGLLKAKLAKYRAQLIEAPKGSAGKVSTAAVIDILHTNHRTDPKGRRVRCNEIRRCQGGINWIPVRWQGNCSAMW